MVLVHTSTRTLWGIVGPDIIDVVLNFLGKVSFLKSLIQLLLPLSLKLNALIMLGISYLFLAIMYCINA